MKLLLTGMLTFITLTSVTSGLLMITLPEGKVLHFNYFDETVPAKDLLLPGILLTCSVGLVSVIALVNNIYELPRQLNWAIAAGGITIFWAMAQAFFSLVPGWIDIVYAAVGIAETLAACQLKGLWVV
ncbi:MAG TPA: hypothetical protein VHB48_02515 [Chitinophagaceae bacterium]|nr:hypothetical protein [Chitinophagaceae bacterium]